MPQLTDKLAKAEPPPPNGYRIFNDGGHQDAVLGFGLLITANNARSWVYRYRINRRDRRYTIGAFPSWDAKTARRRAAELARLVDVGRDPQTEKDAARQAPTVGELCARYLQEHAVKKRSFADDERMIERVIKPALGNRKVAEIEFADIDRLHHRITTKGGSASRTKGSPYAANRALSLLSKMFALAVQWKMRADNPCRGVSRNVEQKRKRYLNADEIARLSQALAQYPHQTSANAIRLLLLTGARRMEVLSVKWEQFDLSTGVWVKPDSSTKNKRSHTIPLSPPALALLAQIEKKSEFVFPGRGTDHLTDLKNPWAQISKTAKLEDVRVHDLRHSFASILVSSGRSLPLIGALLGHTNPATTARYAHADLDSLREAVATVGAVVSGPPKAAVVDIAAARRK